jgi:hypothetical protein
VSITSEGADTTALGTPSQGLRLLRLRLAGVTKPYEVDFRDADGSIRPLSVIAGPTNTGKTSVLQLVAYALGGAHYPDHEEIVRQVRSVLLEAEFPTGRMTIERAAESKTALVFDLPLDHVGETVPRVHPVEPAGDPGSLSKFLLSSVGLQGVQLREAPTQEQSDTDALSFRDLMWLCLILNERVGSTQLLFEGNHNKNLKLRQVVDAVFGVHENESADRARRINDLDNELAATRREVAALREFIRENDATPREQLQQIIDDADAELRAVRTALRTLDEHEAADVKVTSGLRDRHRRAAREALLARQRVHDREAMVNRFASLRAQYADDIRKLTLLKQAGSLFDQLSVRVCPACLSQLNASPRVHNSVCTLCQQHVPMDITSLTLGRVAVVREAIPEGDYEHAGVKGSALGATDPDNMMEETPPEGEEPIDEDAAQRLIGTELASTRRRFNELNAYWLDLDRSLPVLREASVRAEANAQILTEQLDRSASGSVTPYVAARESVLARRQAALVLRDRANNVLRQWQGVDARQRRIDRLASELAELRREQRSSGDRPAREAVVSALSDRFRSILAELGYPKHEGTGYLDAKLVPHARGRSYHAASSGGRVLQTLAWMLAVYEVAYETNADHPGFLLIDTPQKNLGGAAATKDEEFADVHLVEHFYEHILRWLSSKGQGAQIVIVDNTPPPIAEPHVVVRFTRDPNRGRYGLIDNEKG